MSRRVTNLIESILGSAAAAGTVADVAEATYAPETTSGETPATEEKKGPSVLETAATDVGAAATESGRAAVRETRRKKMVAAALKAKQDRDSAALKKAKQPPPPKDP